MGEKYLLAIDNGTQSTRVSAFDLKGNILAMGKASHPGTTSPQLGWHEHGKNDMWDALCRAAERMYAKFSGDKADCIGIGLSSQRICVHIVDENNELIYNPISWMDVRWRMNYPSFGAMPEDVEDPMYKVFMPYFSLANWMKFNNPDVYQKAAKYLNASGYMGAKLTGAYKDSIANNVGWPYDYQKWEGFKENRYIELMGFRKDQLAEVVWPGTLIGQVSDTAAAAAHLPAGCPVYTCAGDKQCELLGVGAVKHGQTYITLGTLSGMDMVCKDYRPSPSFSYSTFLACYPRMYNFEAALGKGFWLVSWFRENFGQGLKEEAEAQGLSIEALLNKEAEAVPAGSDGLIAIPDWSPPATRPHGKGLFLGFDDRHGRGHMYRALIEGIIMEIKSKSDSMVAALEMPITELYIGGGGSKSDFCAQAIADIFNVPANRSHEPENCSLGAAMCAAVGAGVYASFDDAIEGMVGTFDVFTPNAESHALYNNLRTNVLDLLYPGMEQALKNLADLTGG